MTIYSYKKNIINPDTGRNKQITLFGTQGKITSITGKRVNYQKKGFIERNEAIKYERLQLLNAKQAFDNSMTFGELYDLFISHKANTIKLRSVQEYKLTYETKIKYFFSDLKIDSLTNSLIKKWQDDLLKMKTNNNILLSNEYLSKIQGIFRSIINFGNDNGYIQKIINFKNTFRKTEVKSEIDYYTLSEFKMFIDAIDDNLMYLTLFNLLFYTGIRKGEALALKWTDIKFSEKTLDINKQFDTRNHIVTSPKTKNSYRTVMLPDKCIDSLIKLKAHYKIKSDNSNKFIFGYFKPIAVNSIDLANRKYSKKANIKRIRVHAFRHSHVSLLIHLNFSVFDIAKRIGDTPKMVNNIYGHWTIKSQENMLNSLNAL